MKKDYTRAELQAEMTALQQIFDSVTVADPFQGLLDPATLQPLNKVATIPVLDDTGRGMQVVQGTTGLETVLAQGITVESRPCVLLLQIPVPRRARVTPTPLPAPCTRCRRICATTT